MATRVGTSFADLINFLEAALAGLKGSTGDAIQKKYAADVSDLITDLRKQDDRQEKAKAELHTASRELKATEKEARALAGKIVSYLESVYGKSGPELQKYGFARRQHGGGKSRKKTA
ncbi:MAG: hypothetical protein QME74_02640 [Candidatus Edwardsbacteria bacterium]|nr:hypothetical protein [Candidatus Edwardsbacteria bacterium]